MTSRTLRATLVVAVLMSMFVLPTALLAQEAAVPTQEATALIAPAPAQVDAPLASLAGVQLQAQVWPEAEQGQTVLIVGSQLPTDTPLPAKVQLPIPVGATLIWAGEIGGGGPESDIQAAAKIVEGDNGPVVEFVIGTYRGFQAELYAATPVTEGDRIVTTIEWTQGVEAESLSMAWRVPAGTDDVVLEPDAPGTPQVNESGERLYTLPNVTPAPGDTLTFSASYVRAGTQSTGGGTAVSPLTIALILLGVAVVVLAGVIIRQRNAAIVHEDESAE